MNRDNEFQMNLQLFGEEADSKPEQDTERPPQEAEGAQGEQQKPEKTFTQADVDRMVAQRLAREKRDTEARIKAARQEGFSEAEKLAKMTEQQRVEHEREQAERTAREREESLQQREKDIARRELRATAIETLREKKLSPRLADALDYSSAEACQASIELLEGVMRDAVQEGVDARIAQARSPLKRNPAGSEAALMAQMRSAMGLNTKNETKER